MAIGQRSNLDKLTTTERRGTGQAPPDSVPSSAPSSYPLASLSGADDLKAIEALTGTGSLHRTGTNTWVLRQSLHTTDTPQFARLGLGQAADATAVLAGVGYGALTVGINLGATGQSAPSTTTPLKVKREGASVFALISNYVTSAAGPTLILAKGRGTYAVPVYPSSGDQLGNIEWRGSDNATLNDAGTAAAHLRVITSEAHGSGTRGVLFQFTQNLTGTDTEVQTLRLSGGGNVLIGTGTSDSGMTGAGNLQGFHSGGSYAYRLSNGGRLDLSNNDGGGAIIGLINPDTASVGLTSHIGWLFRADSGAVNTEATIYARTVDTTTATLESKLELAYSYLLDGTAGSAQANRTATLDRNGFSIPLGSFVGTSFKMWDSDASHTLELVTTSNLTANRALTLVPGDAARTITLSGNPTLADWFDQGVKTTSNVQHALMGIGRAVSASYLLAVAGGAAVGLLLGSDQSANTITDATLKRSRVGVPHYTNAEEPIGVFSVDGNSTTNVLNLGGGTSLLNAVTTLAFYTAANFNTVTGTERGRFTATGNFLVGGTSETGLTGGGGLRIFSTTEATASAGALVVDGGVLAQKKLATLGGVIVQFGSIGMLIGADASASTLTDATAKTGRIGTPHYTNAEEPVALFSVQSQSTFSALDVGGGTSLMNAVTIVRFYTAADITTVTGTERMRISAAANLLIGGTSDTGLTGSGGLRVFSTTEATASAGALVVDGGILAKKKVFATSFGVGANQVVGARDTGWTAWSGSATNKATAYDTATITLPQLAERVRALQEALTTHGLLGT